MSKPNGLARAAMSFLRSPKGKRVGGRVLQGASRVADRATGRRYTERIDGARRTAEQGLERL